MAEAEDGGSFRLEGARAKWRVAAQRTQAYGGLGATFAYDAAVFEDMESIVPEALGGVTVSSGIVAHYILKLRTEEQKRRWLPGMARGELIGAIAMTEPGTGSDLQNVRTSAQRKGNSYVINGQKTFITNGQTADLIILVARTGGVGSKGISLIVLETEGNPGFKRGRNLDKIGPAGLRYIGIVLRGRRGAVREPARRGRGAGLQAVDAAVAAGAAHHRGRGGRGDGAGGADHRRIHKERKAFGQPIIDFQNTAFKLAERKTEATIARVFLDWCIERLIAGDLDAVTASMAKWWCTQKQVETVDECLQLHGGYGYMQEYPISRSSSMRASRRSMAAPRDHEAPDRALVVARVRTVRNTSRLAGQRLERRRMSMVLTERRGSVTILTLNNPAQYNALAGSLLRELSQALDAASADASVRAILLTGAGKGFCAGAQLGGGNTFEAGEKIGDNMRATINR